LLLLFIPSTSISSTLIEHPTMSQAAIENNIQLIG
jgi:hypothetical protein